MLTKESISKQLAKAASQLYTSGKLHDAIMKMNQSIAIADNPISRVELSKYHIKSGQFELALRELKFASMLIDAPDIDYFRGNIFRLQEEFTSALSEYDKVIARNESLRDLSLLHGALYGKADIALRTGDYANGWAFYSDRLSDSKRYRIPFEGMLTAPPIPRSINVICEQGNGDNIMFARCLKDLCQSTAVTLWCPQRLKRLFSNSFSFEQIFDETMENEYLPAQPWCYIGSLPRLLSYNSEEKISSKPYLRTNKVHDNYWEELICKKKQKLNVGLLWAGSKKNNDTRTDSVSIYTKLITELDCNYFSLQIGDASQQLYERNWSGKVIDFTDRVKDFADTASLIMNLDIIITVDTSVAHLAGALGIECWVLIPYESDWRWGLRNSKESVWYGDTLRLFKQESPVSWDSILYKLYKALKARLVQSLQ